MTTRQAEALVFKLNMRLCNDEAKYCCETMRMYAKTGVVNVQWYVEINGRAQGLAYPVTGIMLRSIGLQPLFYCPNCGCRPIQSPTNLLNSRFE